MVATAAALAAIAPMDQSFVLPRRFFLPDMDRHPWLVARLCETFKITDRQAIGWLRSLIESPEFCFLYLDNSAGLFEVTRQHTLAVKPILTERFVWCRDATDKAQVAEAVAFYEFAATWAKNKDIDTIIVEENSDVPHEVVREIKKLGRVLERKQWFAKVT